MNSVGSVARKYIVDVVGDLPVILMELDPADMSIKKCYIYANAEILSEHDGGGNCSLLQPKLAKELQKLALAST